MKVSKLPDNLDPSCMACGKEMPTKIATRKRNSRDEAPYKSELVFDLSYNAYAIRTKDKNALNFNIDARMRHNVLLRNLERPYSHDCTIYAPTCSTHIHCMNDIMEGAKELTEIDVYKKGFVKMIFAGEIVLSPDYFPVKMRYLWERLDKPDIRKDVRIEIRHFSRFRPDQHRLI